MSTIQYGTDGALTIDSLHAAMTIATSTSNDSVPRDTVFKDVVPTLSTTRQISAPNMRRTDGKYRANQIEILTASTPAAFHEMNLRRRDMCL
jgi:hypothetical protein